MTKKHEHGLTADAAALAHLEEVAERLERALGQELVGAYAGGSIALDDYLPGRSDVDVAAVTRGRLVRERKEAVAEALRHESLPCPARGLELLVYSEAVARVPSPEPGFELDLNSGASMPFKLTLDASEVVPHWYLIDRAILAARGRTLSGPPAADVFAPVPRSMLLPLLVESIRWHAADPLALPDDAVLNACRALRYAEEDEWSGKAAASRWAQERLADGAVVADALAARQARGRVPRRSVDQLLDKILARLDEAAATADEGGTTCSSA
jgi:hypothetical protein